VFKHFDEDVLGVEALFYENEDKKPKLLISEVSTSLISASSFFDDKVSTLSDISTFFGLNFPLGIAHDFP